ncbi:tetraacyldisaccharide 4'-kinase, partial [Acinetobacter baumannii]
DFELKTTGLEFDCESVPREIDLLCAVGSPGRLLRGVEEAGLRVVQKRIEADHAPLDDLGLIDGLGVDRPLLVTAKDWVKLRRRNDLGERVVIVAD